MRSRLSHVVLCLIAVFLTLGWNAAVNAQSAAQVIFTLGEPVATNAAGELRPLSAKTSVAAGDTIDTKEGRVQLLFTDGALMSLQPHSVLRIDEYRYSGANDGSERSFFTLLKGGLRTITGAIGKAKASVYQIITDLATIGVRGTEYSILLDASGLTGSVGEGAIDVCNGAGCFRSASGESYGVSDTTSRPQMRGKKTDLAATQPQSAAGGFAAGESRGRNGELIAVEVPRAAPTTIPEPQRAAAIVYSEQHSAVSDVFAQTNATLQPQAALRSIDMCSAGCVTRWNEPVADSGNDALIAWGRWTNGSTVGFHTLDLTQGRSLHYVVGNAGDINLDALRARNTVAQYALIGYTTPTSIGTVQSSRLIDANLTAYFTANPSVEFGVRVSAGNHELQGLSIARMNGSTFSGHGPSQPNVNASLGFSGFFTGANADRAGVVYELQSAQGTFVGAAAFAQEPTR